MPDITIIRGDSYALRRPLYVYTFVDILGEPYDLAGCTVRTTFKPEIIPIESDPDDISALVRHDVVVGLDGTPVSNGLILQGYAHQGVVRDHFTAAETKVLEPHQRLISDLQLTDVEGEVMTWMWDDGFIAIDSVTNRDVL